MDNQNSNERWVMERLSSLAAPKSWSPSVARARGRLLARRDRNPAVRVRWTVAAASAAAVVAVMIALPQRGSCAQGTADGSCAKAPESAAVQLPAPQSPSTPEPLPAPKPIKASAPAPVPLLTDYKTTGAPDAPLVLEIYSDFECPHCATFFEQTLPEFKRRFVATGKVRLVHRDLPLPSHPYAKLAARYADAAGALGYYEAAVRQLFRTQQEWHVDGRVDERIAAVIPPAVMPKLRELVENSAELDRSLDRDLSAARSDEIEMTPTLVIVHHGKRQKLAPVPPLLVLDLFVESLGSTH